MILKWILASLAIRSLRLLIERYGYLRYAFEGFSTYKNATCLFQHHCRNCGQIFCSDCSSKRATMSNFKNPQRVCDGCYGESFAYLCTNGKIFLKTLYLISAEIQQSKWHLGNPISGGRGRQQSMDQASSGLTGSLPNDVAVRRTTSSNLWDEEVHWTPNNAEKSDSSKRWLIFSVKLIIHRIVTCSRPICMPCAFLLQLLPFFVDFSSP